MFRDLLFWFLDMAFCFLVCSLIVIIVFKNLNDPFALENYLYENFLKSQFKVLPPPPAQKKIVFVLAKCLEHYQSRQLFTTFIMCVFGGYRNKWIWLEIYEGWLVLIIYFPRIISFAGHQPTFSWVHWGKSLWESDFYRETFSF